MADWSWLGDYIEQVLRGPSWTVPIAEFVDEHCVIFREVDEEHTFPQNGCHQKFTELIESLFCAHLIQVDVGPDDFAQYAGAELTKESHARRLLVDQLGSVSDFLVFKKMMVARNIALDSEAAKEADTRPALQEIANTTPTTESTAVAPMPGHKAGASGREFVLNHKKAERDAQLRKWLEDPAPAKSRMTSPVKKMSAATVREMMRTGTNPTKPEGNNTFLSSLKVIR